MGKKTCYWQENIHIDKWHRIEGIEMNTHIYIHLNFNICIILLVLRYEQKSTHSNVCRTNQIIKGVYCGYLQNYG